MVDAIVPNDPEATFVAPGVQPEPQPGHLAAQPSLKPVAKVAATGVGGIALVIVVAILSGIAPDTFNELGIWGPVVAAAITALAAFISGYVKRA